VDFDTYETGGFFDELFESCGVPRPCAEPFLNRVKSLPPGEVRRRQRAAEAALFQMGITFTVYDGNQGTDRIFPFDIIPRIVDSKAWETIDKGIRQRIEALNLFIDDVYHKQRILNDGVVPRELIYSSKSFREQCIGLNPPKGIWCHVTGTDLIRDKDGDFYVLEDNLRCPSGVSYVLENRQVLKRTFPQVFESIGVRPVEEYPNKLLETLTYLAGGDHHDPNAVVLTPGVYNSAYFEHSFLAQQMGVELVEGRDLVVKDDRVYQRTTKGFEPVDVVYRRIDDDFIDPYAFRHDSLLGVPGIFEAYRRGNVALVNAPGAGIADDKAVYAYVPRIIKYYLDQDMILPNVETYICAEEKELAYVLENIEQLVIKAVNESGGYGMLVGPHSTREQCDDFRNRVRENPRNYIGQPTLSLSRVPILVEDHFEGRHVDLRPYALYGERIYVMPGGLTRVALRKGSLVVNSSQGGGSKDTWVLYDGKSSPATHG
jgi:uncharacterized circularly permuted ATP-grasp superfamily protein